MTALGCSVVWASGRWGRWLSPALCRFCRLRHSTAGVWSLSSPFMKTILQLSAWSPLRGETGSLAWVGVRETLEHMFVLLFPHPFLLRGPLPLVDETRKCWYISARVEGCPRGDRPERFCLCRVAWAWLGCFYITPSLYLTCPARTTSAVGEKTLPNS